MDFTLRQIRYFVAAAEAGQISNAAAKLGVSQSAVTEAVRSLEKTARIKLINRHSRGISLTHEGYKFLGHARKVLFAVADAGAAIRTTNSSFSGQLRVGVTATVAGYFLPSPLARFHRTFPKVEIEIIEFSRPDIEEHLNRGTIDIGFALLAHFEDVGHIETATLLQSRRRVWLSPSHPLVEKQEVRFAEIANAPYLLLTIDENVRTTTGYWAAAGLQPNITFRTSSIEALRSLIANGFGITILSDMVYRPWSLEGERIIARPLADPIPPLDVGLAWRRDREISEATRVFRDFFIEGAPLAYAQFSSAPGPLPDSGPSAQADVDVVG